MLRMTGGPSLDRALFLQIDAGFGAGLGGRFHR